MKTNHSQPDAVHAAPSTTLSHPDLTKPVRGLTCTCCGSAFKGRQFHNQDTGYGLGDCCVEYVRPRVDDVERTYGVAGVHYGGLGHDLTQGQ